MATLATRVISGKGLLRLPASADLRKAKRLSLYVDVIRLPFNGYYNANYNPPKGRYATLNFFKTGYLQKEACVEYPRQRFDFTGDMSAQTSYYVKCAYHLTIAHLNEMKQKLGLLMDDTPDPFTDWYHTEFAFDEIKVVCYADTAVRLVVESEEFQLCPDDEDPDPFPPPPPPDEPTDVPPGTSLGEENTPVSDPYQEPDDGGDTVPYFGDDFTPPEGGDTGDTESGTIYVVSYQWKQFTGGSILSEFVYAFGVIGDIRLKPGDSSVFQLWCQGKINNPVAPGSPLPSPTWVDIATRAYSTSVELEVVDVSLY